MMKRRLISLAVPLVLGFHLTRTVLCNLLVGPLHVVVGRGREYGDVPPLKGVYAGPASTGQADVAVVGVVPHRRGVGLDLHFEDRLHNLEQARQHGDLGEHRHGQDGHQQKAAPPEPHPAEGKTRGDREE